MSERIRILSGLAAELTFAILPLLVVLMVVLHEEHSVHLFGSPEWSFGAAILFGQSVVKFISGIARKGGGEKGPIALFMALIVVLGLVPSLIVLTMALQAIEHHCDPTRGLQTMQIILFLVGCITYVVFGLIAEEWKAR